MTKTATNPATAATASKEQKKLEAKWGKQAIAAGWTALPNVVFLQQKALKLERLDVLVLLHLSSYWWNPKENPRPSKGRIADALDVDPRTVQRSVEKMEAMGYVRRIERKARAGDNMPNEYDLSGLVKRIKALAEKELAIQAQRKAEDKTRVRTPTAFGLIKGGKA